MATCIHSIEVDISASNAHSQSLKTRKSSQSNDIHHDKQTTSRKKVIGL